MHPALRIATMLATVLLALPSFAAKQSKTDGGTQPVKNEKQTDRKSSGRVVTYPINVLENNALTPIIRLDKIDIRNNETIVTFSARKNPESKSFTVSGAGGQAPLTLMVGGKEYPPKVVEGINTDTPIDDADLHVFSVNYGVVPYSANDFLIVSEGGASGLVKKGYWVFSFRLEDNQEQLPPTCKEIEAGAIPVKTRYSLSGVRECLNLSVLSYYQQHPNISPFNSPSMDKNREAAWNISPYIYQSNDFERQKGVENKKKLEAWEQVMSSALRKASFDISVTADALLVRVSRGSYDFTHNRYPIKVEVFCTDKTHADVFFSEPIRSQWGINEGVRLSLKATGSKGRIAYLTFADSSNAQKLQEWPSIGGSELTYVKKKNVACRYKESDLERTGLVIGKYWEMYRMYKLTRILSMEENEGLIDGSEFYSEIVSLIEEKFPSIRGTFKIAE